LRQRDNPGAFSFDHPISLSYNTRPPRFRDLGREGRHGEWTKVDVLCRGFKTRGEEWDCLKVKFR